MMSIPKLLRVRRAEATDAIWGDDIAGFVTDKVYRSDPALSFVVSSLPSGGHFTFSDRAWPVSESCNAIYVLKGSLTALVPQTGEVKTACPGDVIVVPPRVWHFGYNFSDVTAEFIECLGPAQPGTPRKDLPKPVPPFPEWEKVVAHGAKEASRTGESALIIGTAVSATRAIIGNKHPLLGEILVNHPLAAVLRLTIPAGRQSDLITLPHDTMCYCLDGTVQIQTTEPQPAFTALDADDALHLVRGTRFRCTNPGTTHSRLLVTLTGSMSGSAIGVA